MIGGATEGTLGNWYPHTHCFACGEVAVPHRKQNLPPGAPEDCVIKAQMPPCPQEYA